MPTESQSEEVTALLGAIADGDTAAGQRLFSVLYGELHRIASMHMSKERSEHTLQPTALVHEAYLRLVGGGLEGCHYNDRHHFVAAASIAMRRILVNHAKANSTEKRGGGRPLVDLDHATASFNDRSIDLLALDEALEQLAERDATQARLVELRFFGGMSVEECAEHLKVSERTVHYEWAHAKAWLRGQLEPR